MRITLVFSLTALLVLSSLPLPAASSTPTGYNDAVVTAPLAAALETATGDLKVIVYMGREFSADDVDFFEENDAKLYGRLGSLPVAFMGLDAATVVSLSWRGGVKQLDLDREIPYAMQTATVATQAAAVWGALGKPGVTSQAPLVDGAGNVIDGAGVSVAVVDSGVDATHPDLVLGEKVIVNKKHVCSTPFLAAGSFFGAYEGRCLGNSALSFLLDTAEVENPAAGDIWADLPNTDTSSGHGTHVAGIVAGTGAASGGRHMGAAPGAKLVGLGAGDVLFISSALEAWDFVNLNHDNASVVGDSPIRVVTNSFGDCAATGTPGGPDYALISQMVAKGIVFTFAAGNVDSSCDHPTDGSVDTTSSYCDYSWYLEGVICVANGNDQNRALRATMPLADSSSRGKISDQTTWPDVTAPGESIVAPWALTGAGVAGPISNDAPYYTTLTGTSMATPHVAGVVALLLQANPALTPAQVEDILEDTALPIAGATGAGTGVADPTNPDSTTSFDQGHGLVDALAAVKEALAATGAGSGLHGVAGGLNVYQAGLANPFVLARGFSPVVQGTSSEFGLRQTVAAPWAGVTVGADSDVEFRLVSPAGDTVATVPADTHTVETSGAHAYYATWDADVPSGDYVLQAHLDGLLVDLHTVRVVTPPVDARDFVPSIPACVAEATALSFTPGGLELAGVVAGPNPVDKVRVDAVLDGASVAHGVQSREDAAGLTQFRVPLGVPALPEGSVLQVTFLSQEVPCFASVTVPDVTPEGLASLQPAGLAQVDNPYLNPGFEVTTVAEPNTQVVPDPRLHGKLVAPPTVLYVDDPAGGVPASTHEVAIGAGTSGNALVLHWDANDSAKNVLLGQLFGYQDAPFVWAGATGVSFDLKSSIPIEDIQIGLHHGAEADVRAGGVITGIAASDEWRRYTVAIDVPEGDPLRALLLRFRSAESGDIHLDNVKVEGATFSVVNLQNDLTDGYAVILLPDESLPAGAAPELGLKATGLGEKYLVETVVRDFTAVTPRDLPRSEMGTMLVGVYGAGSLPAEVGTTQVGGPAAVSAVDPARVLFAIDSAVANERAPGGLAALWAFGDVLSEGGYVDTLGRPTDAAFGYYGATKNALQDYSLADSLDHAITPVRLGGGDAEDVREATSVAVVVPEGSTGFQVRVESAATGWVESATVSVTGHPDRTVTLDGLGSTLYLQYEGAADGLTARILPTLFTAGDVFVTGTPLPVVRVCADAPGCAEDALEFLSLEAVSFDGSESGDPLGEGLDYGWDFGDGNGATGPQVTHIYGAPGEYTVTLTVTDGDGRSDSSIRTVRVLNRAPAVTLDAPAAATRLDAVAISAGGADVDGSVAYVVVKVDGVEKANATGDAASVSLLAGELALGSHTVEAYAVDDSGATSAVASATITVTNLGPSALLAAGSTLVAVGGEVAFTAVATDADGPAPAAVLDFGDGSAPLALAETSAAHAYAAAGPYEAVLTVTDADGATATSAVTIFVDGVAPTTGAVLPASRTGWYNEPARVTLTIADDHAGAKALYAIDGGAETEYAAPFDVDGEGIHTVAFHGVDAVGNVESPGGSATVRIDLTSPEVVAEEMPQDMQVVSGVVTIRGGGTDALSGMAAARILIDGVEKASGVDAVAYDFDTTNETIGSFDVTLEVEDLAGNLASTTVTIIVLNGPAGALPALPAETSGAAAPPSAVGDVLAASGAAGIWGGVSSSAERCAYYAWATTTASRAVADRAECVLA